MKNKLFDMFVGRNVVVVTKNGLGREGFFLDMDEKFVFLGNIDGIITRAVSLDSIEDIYDIEEDYQEKVKQIFDNMPEGEMN